MSDPLSPVILSKLSALPVGAIKSVQNGVVSSAMSSGSGQDSKYLDVTISSVNPAKCVVRFTGGIGDNAQEASAKSISGWLYQPFVRLTSATNLRIHFNGTYKSFVNGQWTVEEFH